MRGDNNQPAGGDVLLILAVLLLLLVQAAASSSAAAVDGRSRGRVVISYAAAEALMRRVRLEDEVAPELTGGGQRGGINYDPLRANRAACGDSCAAAGVPYTQHGSGCQPIYGCRPQ